MGNKIGSKTKGTERKGAKEALQESEARYRNLYDSIKDGIIMTDMKGNVLECNQACLDMLGYTKEEITKLAYQKLTPAKWRMMEADIVEHKIVENGYSDEYEKEYIRKDRTIFPINIRVWLIKDEQGKPVGMWGIVRDITERKKAERELAKLNEELIKSNKRLRQLTLKDPQTGLFNHRYLPDVIEREFDRAKRYVDPLSLIMMDIDYFKSINDVYGHQFGDIILKQFAMQLKRMVRRYDILIRFGGEEFVIISPGMDRAKAMVLAQRLLEAIRLYNFGDKKNTVKLKLSIAVASYPEDRITSGMELVELSDKILDKAKEKGGDRAYSSLDIAQGKGPISGRGAERDDVESLKEKIAKLSKRGNESIIEAIFAFARTIELKDHYTGEHAEKTVHYAIEIAKALGLYEEDLESIKEAAILHDLGKIGVSDKILLKKSKLTKKEFNEIKKHPQVGVDIIRPIHFLHSIIPLMLYHHERWDGKGYPIGLRGEEIPIGARIIAIADVYQALTSDRPYRKAYPEEEAIKIIKKGAGTQFDPKVVNIFLKILKKRK